MRMRTNTSAMRIATTTLQTQQLRYFIRFDYKVHNYKAISSIIDIQFERRAV